MFEDSENSEEKSKQAYQKHVERQSKKQRESNKTQEEVNEFDYNLADGLNSMINDTKTFKKAYKYTKEYQNIKEFQSEFKETFADVLDYECIVFDDNIGNITKFTKCLTDAVNDYNKYMTDLGDKPKYNKVIIEEEPYRNPSTIGPEIQQQQDKAYKQFEKINNTPVIENKTFLATDIDLLMDNIREYLKGKLSFKINVNYNYIVEEYDSNKNDYKYRTQNLSAPLWLGHKDMFISNNEDIKVFLNSIVKQVQNCIETAQTISTKEKYVALYAVTLCKYNIIETGKGDFEELEQYEKFKNIVVSNQNDNLCLFKALYYHFVSVGKAKHTKSAGTKMKIAKEYFKEYYGQKYTKEYQGFIWNNANIEDFCKKFLINIDKYEFDTQSEELSIESSYNFGYNDTMNLISHTLKNGAEHVMFLKDFNLGQVLICRKCYKHTYNNTLENRKKYRKHIENCTGDIKQKMQTSLSIPYCPVFYKNKLYAYSRVHNFTYTPLKYYMTYDFETCDQLVNSKKQKSVINAYLEPFSVALSWNEPTGEIQTMYYCLYEFNSEGKLEKNPNFIRQFFHDCFRVSNRLQIYNKENFINNMEEDKYEQLKDNQYFKDYLNKYSRTVSVFGWNSEKFDSNFLRPYLNSLGSKEIHILGTTTSSKQITIKDPDTKIKTCFKDAENYVTKCSLDAATKSYGKQNIRVKGVFPYSKLNSETIETELLRTKPFEQKDFFNSLTQEPLSDADYEMYLNDYKQYKNFYEYSQYYNEQDTKIMFCIIDNLIDMYNMDNVDCLNNLSISSLASSIKYLMCYDNFDINTCYSPKKVDETLQFKLKKETWTSMVKRYLKQDIFAKRDPTNNVKDEDYEYFAKMINSKDACCWSCLDKFTYKNRPTLDRIDNNIGHTKENVRLACRYCNIYCRDLDSDMRRFYIQLRRYAYKNGLPFNIDNEQDIKFVQKDINGGLSNVEHRVNLKGENTITKLQFDPETTAVSINDTKNVITHFSSIDFNSLYPSCFSGEYHPCCKYTNGRMYMPGYLVSSMECKTEAQKKRAIAIINNKNRFNDKAELFIAEVKGTIPKRRINECINFLPIIRNLNVDVCERVLGSYMCDYMEKNNYGDMLTSSNKPKKLTQTYSTDPILKYYDDLYQGNAKNDGYMTFSSYYLWFLIDQFGFIIEDVKYIQTYSKHLAFNKFVNTFTERRQNAKLNDDKLGEIYNKIILNSSYGFDSIRSDKFNKAKLVNKAGAFKAHRNPYHIDTIELNKDFYLVTEQTKSYSMETPLQVAAFTLDNAKYWYLNFIYNFMEKCLDMNKIHFVEGDTDSLYFAISGNPEETDEQGLKYVIKDEKFYNENVFKWLPYDYYCTDENYRPKLETPEEKIKHEKKLLGCAIEKQGYNIVALGPKCYTTWGSEKKGNETTLSLKVKGIDIRTNKHISSKSYLEVIRENKVINGTNYLLQYKKISKQENEKSNKAIITRKINEYKKELENLITSRPKYKIIKNEYKDELREIRILSLEKEIETLEEIIKNGNYKEYYNTDIYKYCRITLNKTALTGLHIKMRVIDDNCQTCIPLYMAYQGDIEMLENIGAEYKDKEENSVKIIDYIDKSGYNFNKHSYEKFDEYNYLVHTQTIDEDHFIYDNYNYKNNIHPCLQYPTQHFNKYCKTKGEIKKYWQRKNITGIALNINESPFAVIDFDIKASTEEERDKIRQEIIEKYKLNTGLVKTTSGGLHYYVMFDKYPEWYENKSRYIKCFSTKDYEIDVMLPFNGETNFIMFPGSKAKNHQGEIRQYVKINSNGIKQNWSFKDINKFSDFDETFLEVEHKYLIEKPVIKTSIMKNFTHKIQTLIIEKPMIESKTLVKQTVNQDILDEFVGETIHGNTYMTAFKLLLALACFNNDDYYNSIQFIKQNCKVTEKAESTLNKYEDDIESIRDSQYFHKYNGNVMLKKLLKSKENC